MAIRLSRTQWGGVHDPQIPSSGFFHAAQIGRRWWLIDPNGGRFLSKGINNVRFEPDSIQITNRVPYAEACRHKYGSKIAWQAATARRLLSWGFNSLGAWSDEAVGRGGATPLAVLPNLDLGASYTWQTRFGGEQTQPFPDVFDEGFDTHVRNRARELCQSRRDDPGILGWFTDNELRWGPDWRGTDELLTIFFNLPPASPGRRAAIALMHERYRQFHAFNAVWCTAARSWEELSRAQFVVAPYGRNTLRGGDKAAEHPGTDSKHAAFVADCETFVSRLAQRYFESTRAAIKAADPNHMVLGCRFAYVPRRAIIENAAQFADVVSFNCYEFDPSVTIDAYAWTGKPCMITEFSFRGDDSGLPNTIGAGPRVATQADRARCYREYVTAGLHQPSFVGYHWFEYADQPAEGRFDGENSNYGAVTIHDDVYEDLTRTMTAVNNEADRIHRCCRARRMTGRMQADARIKVPGAQVISRQSPG